MARHGHVFKRDTLRRAARALPAQHPSTRHDRRSPRDNGHTPGAAAISLASFSFLHFCRRLASGTPSRARGRRRPLGQGQLRGTGKISDPVGAPSQAAGYGETTLHAPGGSLVPGLLQGHDSRGATPTEGRMSPSHPGVLADRPPGVGAPPPK